MVSDNLDGLGGAPIAPEGGAQLRSRFGVSRSDDPSARRLR